MPRPKRANIFDKLLYWTIDNFAVPLGIRLHIHPNVVTLCGFIPLYFQYLAIINCHTMGIHLYGIINYWFDCLDGELARKSNKVTKFGGYLDTIHDSATGLMLLYFVEYRLPFIAIIVVAFLVTCVFGRSVLHSHRPTYFHRIFYLVHDNLNIFYCIINALIAYSHCNRI